MGRTAASPVIYKGSVVPGFEPQIGNSSDGDLWVDQTVPALKRKVSTNPDVWVSIEGSGAAAVFNKGAVMLQPTPGAIIAWQAPFACTVTNVRAYQDLGTGSTFNARRNGSLNHLASDATITSAATWIDGGAVQNQSYSTNDKLEILIQSVNGNPTQLAILVDFTQP